MGKGQGPLSRPARGLRVIVPSAPAEGGLQFRGRRALHSVWRGRVSIDFSWHLTIYRV